MNVPYSDSGNALLKADRSSPTRDKQADFILLDRSGSMSGLWVEALSSINAYVKKLAEDKVPTRVTLATFDTVSDKNDFSVIRDRTDPALWIPVTDKDTTPRGMTPLNDSTAKIIDLAESGNYDKVAIIIMTDGHENHSTEYSVVQIKDRLERCRQKNWQVIFLGANFDNARQAASYGNQAGMTISSSAKNLGATMRSTAEKRYGYSVAEAATADSMSFTEEEKKKAAS